MSHGFGVMQRLILATVTTMLESTREPCRHTATTVYVSTQAAARGVCGCHVVSRWALLAALRLDRVQRGEAFSFTVQDASARRALRRLLQAGALCRVWPVGTRTRRGERFTFPSYLPESQHPDVISVPITVIK